MKRDTACELAFVFGQEQTDLRVARSRPARLGEFLVKVLKAQAEAEGLRVFEEELAGLSDLGWGFCLSECKTSYHRGHRGHRGISGSRIVRGFISSATSVFSVVKILFSYPISMPPFTFRTWPVM